MAATSRSAQVKFAVESALAKKSPSALSPRPRTIRERLASGVDVLDHLLDGGLPVGAISEFVGVTGSGRTTAALAFAAAVAQDARIAAWVDVADAFDPTSAALNGVDLARLLWVRCAQQQKSVDEPVAQKSAVRALISNRNQQALPVRGGGSPHPRSEGLGMSEAIQSMMRAHGGLHDHQSRRERKKIGTPGMPNRPLKPIQDREEQIPSDRQPSRREKAVRAAQRSMPGSADCDQSNTQTTLTCAEAKVHQCASLKNLSAAQEASAKKPFACSVPSSALQSPARMRTRRPSWTALEHALRTTDLLLQAGGFGMIVLDLGDTPADMSWRIPLATWFRYRSACDHARTSLVVLTQHPCARSSAELVVHMDAGAMQDERTVFTGLRFHAEVQRQRFQQMQSAQETNVIAFRKPPQRANSDLYSAQDPKGTWRVRVPWAV